ncbi:ATP-grasp fold amidoligase family protein [Solibacillus isronensis]|uniref:ATP-grasp fold amidoligase family protein n=1 Tax=Solibacillus isronensis TaxID=412383 RepID=UPI00204010CC|nr:ATP-grasp fold amidoligase family protein [Solibacillus isronensis]MCM3722102.1 glycosyl transferase [Solibacillus isronensis]
MNIKNIIKKNENFTSFYRNIRYFYLKSFVSDERLIRKQFRKIVGRELDLNNPVYFNDKLQWLKVNWYDPIATMCADKFEVRNFVKEQIGEKYLNELYAVYDSVDEIDIKKLPDSFVLKGTHGSGSNLICKDKNSIDWNKQVKIMKGWLNKNLYWYYREWVYKDIKPRIVCEKYMSEGLGTNSLTDYKFFCFNGEVKYCQVIRGRGINETIDFYDIDWNHMPFTGLRPLPNSKETYLKPKKYNEMLDLAKKLSESFPFVRVDFYYVNEEIIFGELTFFPRSGYGSFYPTEWDKKIGDLLTLNK